jgi:Glycosyl transferases group 1
VVAADRTGLPRRGYDRVLGPLTPIELARTYAETDVLLKLSRVEGMSGPPLEAFHCGATCVVTPVTGHDEYVEHGWNGMVVDWDDERGTAGMLDLLARDRRLLHFLRTNAIVTARGWPSWAQSTQFMALALEMIRARPAAGVPAAGLRLASDARAGIERQRLERDDLAARAERFRLERDDLAARAERFRLERDDLAARAERFRLERDDLGTRVERYLLELRERDDLARSRSVASRLTQLERSLRSRRWLRIVGRPARPLYRRLRAWLVGRAVDRSAG